MHTYIALQHFQLQSGCYSQHGQQTAFKTWNCSKSLLSQALLSHTHTFHTSTGMRRRHRRGNGRSGASKRARGAEPVGHEQPVAGKPYAIVSEDAVGDKFFALVEIVPRPGNDRTRVLLRCVCVCEGRHGVGACRSIKMFGRVHARDSAGHMRSLSKVP